MFALLSGGAVWVFWQKGYLRNGNPKPFSSGSVDKPVPPLPELEDSPATTPPRLPVSALVVVPRTNTAIPTNPPPVKSSAVLEAQVALDRIGISSGSVDGVMGSQTRTALRAFQWREALPQTGELDETTRSRLPSAGMVLSRYRVELEDVTRLLPLAGTWLGKSEQERLDYQSLIELIAEKHHAHPGLIQRLNSAVDWNSVGVGAEIVVPMTKRYPPTARAAFLQIRLSQRTLQAFDGANRLIAHFPCSIAQRVEKRPVGELVVAVLAPNPNYTFDPEIFPESAEARELGRKLVLPPGPNNPVGAVWIGLNRPGYGIHGTPKPEEVGRTESHGCFRLANWNAEYLLQLVTIGTPVRVEE